MDTIVLCVVDVDVESNHPSCHGIVENGRVICNKSPYWSDVIFFLSVKNLKLRGIYDSYCVKCVYYDFILLDSALY